MRACGCVSNERCEFGSCSVPAVVKGKQTSVSRLNLFFSKVEDLQKADHLCLQGRSGPLANVCRALGLLMVAQITLPLLSSITPFSI